MNHLTYDLALQQIKDRTTRQHTVTPEHRMRRRTARTLRRLAAGLDHDDEGLG